MKFYIPTSNLNLDNILQSECILPILHYSKRCSGYKNYEQIEELRHFQGIVLFKYPVSFTINDSGRYNFPMLIELEDDKQTYDFADNEVQEGVCICGHRLNITPSNCRIYFFSESAYKLTLINTQSNKGIKYYKEYKIYPTVSMLKLKEMPFLKEIDAVEISQFEDTVLDKQKGLFYAFLLGNIMSVNQNLAKQLRLTQEIYNILTNLISSPSNFSFFENKLNVLLCEYKKVDEIEKKAFIAFNAHFDDAMGTRFKFLKESFIAFLKKIDCWDMVFDSLCKKWNCSFLPDASKLKSNNNFASLRDEIERRTNLAVFDSSKMVPKNILEMWHIMGLYPLCNDAFLINIVIKFIISHDITPEILSAKRMDFYMSVMKEVVERLKDELGEEKWVGSKEQHYVNSLYSFISDPANHFDLNDIDNLELKSIAAFILKGQSFKDYTTYLKMNEMTDYRYALALWGCLCGYMEISKDALERVLSMENYGIVYNKMFNSDLAVISPNNNMPLLQSNESDIDYNLFRLILGILKYKNADSLIDTMQKEGLSESIAESQLEKILDLKSFRRASKQNENARIALRIYLNRNDEELIIEVLSSSGLSSKSQKDILSNLGYNEKKKKNSNRKKASNNNESKSLFPENNVKYEPDRFPKLDCFSSLDERAVKKIEENWIYTGKGKHSDKHEHIRHFINLCKKEGRGEMVKDSPLLGIFTETLAQKADKELKDIYGI